MIVGRIINIGKTHRRVTEDKRGLDAVLDCGQLFCVQMLVLEEAMR